MRASVIGTGALAFGPAFWREALAAPAQAGPGPYGPLQAADANGIMLPAGFTSRAIAQGGQTVPGTGYTWHAFSDGQATYATEDGGFILVSNSENPPDLGIDSPDAPGGASAIRFRADGSIADAYRILGGTRVNCAGGATPWGTWLSCEEHNFGQVWECDPTGQATAVAHPAMGIFEHEAVAVDPDGEHVYLSEDNAAGGFYRFTPDRYPELASGRLEVAKVGSNGRVEWIAVPDPSAGSAPTREQVSEMTRFNRGEGIWFDSGIVYLCTTNDDRIHTYDTKSGRMDVLYDGATFEDPPLTNVDNITVSRSGDVFVCEDTTNSDDPGLDIGLITPDREVTRFLKVTGAAHTGAGEARSELCGVVFDPTGDRMFFASQRGFGLGVIYEITGPFRKGGGGKDGPDLRVRAPKRIDTRRLLGRGLRFAVVTGEPVEVTAKLTADLPSTRARKRTTIARLNRQLDGDGEHRLRLRPGRSKRRRISRKRSFTARLKVTAVDAAGRRRTVRRKVRVRA